MRHKHQVIREAAAQGQQARELRVAEKTNASGFRSFLSLLQYLL